MHSLTSRRCGRCGSLRIRRARTHGYWQRAVRALTPLERYACGECGNRGWRIPSGERPDREKLELGARPVETRDRRADAAMRRRLLLNVIVAVVLGGMVAILLAGE